MLSERIVIQARSIDFMALPPPRAVVPFPRVTKEAVIKFYEDDQFSRLLSGKKDRVSIGKKEYQQKRLILLTLKELFQQFKIQHPDWLFKVLHTKAKMVCCSRICRYTCSMCLLNS